MPELDSPPPLLSTEEVARRLGVDPVTVRRLAQRGELPAVRVGKQWRFDADRIPHPAE